MPNDRSMRIVALRTELLDSPLGVSTRTPEFDWRVVDGASDARQASFRIEVQDADSGRLRWDSGEVESALPYGHGYAGEPLSSSTVYRWRVRVHDDDGRPSDWSEWATFETAKLDAAEFTASWIALREDPPADDSSVMSFRRDLDLPSRVVRGRAIVSACGWYKLFVNGLDLTGTALVPRWTPMDHLVEYQVVDVTEAFREGGNTVGIAVGDGRYRGGLSAFDRRRTYGDRLQAFAQIELDLADGSRVVLQTDESWSAGRGAIVHSDPMRGEVRDLILPFLDWLSGDLPDRFAAVEARPAPTGRLVPESVPQVTDIAELVPETITTAPSGAQLVDFGQNLAGVVRVRLTGADGTRVRITYSELISAAGEIETAYMFMDPEYPRYFRDEVVLDGSEHVFQPWFSIQGFRHVAIEGAQPLTIDDIRAVVLSTDLPSTGSFQCSDPRLERLEQNVRWSLRSNFTDTPTDCPTRERAGWTGDLQVFAETATLLVDAQAYLRMYLRNVEAEQLPDGRIPPYIPSETSAFSGPLLGTLDDVSSSVGWGDVSVMTPWDVYLAYGDRAVLERQYETGKRWVASLEHLAAAGPRPDQAPTRAPHALDRWIVDRGFHWGEWLRPGEGPEAFQRSLIFGRPVVATAYFAHSSRLLAETAAVLGLDDERQHYASQADTIRTAWRHAFVGPDGRIGEDRQDDYVRALAFGLLETQDEAAALGRLVALIEADDMHLGTGFLSTGLLLPTLTAHGRPDIAYRILLQETSPSWLAQVELGATTIWETWDGYHPDGRPKESHNHYALGAVVSWLYHAVAGLQPTAPGWAQLRVDPMIGGGLTRASASVSTPYGQVSSAWTLNDGFVELEVEVPSGVRAVVVLPEQDVTVGSGTHRFNYRWSGGLRMITGAGSVGLA